MRWFEICCLGILAICMNAILYPVAASEDKGSDLRAAVFAFEDERITIYDLAFYLATHGFDATPKETYVELRFNHAIYKLVPNGNTPGLCDIIY
jgi:hypothetical protein